MDSAFAPWIRAVADDSTFSDRLLWSAASVWMSLSSPQLFCRYSFLSRDEYFQCPFLAISFNREKEREREREREREKILLPLFETRGKLNRILSPRSSKKMFSEMWIEDVCDFSLSLFGWNTNLVEFFYRLRLAESIVSESEWMAGIHPIGYCWTRYTAKYGRLEIVIDNNEMRTLLKTSSAAPQRLSWSKFDWFVIEIDRIKFFFK